MKRYEKTAFLKFLKVLCIGVLLIVSSVAVGTTAAYFIDDNNAENVIEIGNVDIELTEPNYPGNQDETVNAMHPHQVVAKDPQITNTGDNDAIVFMKVTVPVREMKIVAHDGESYSTKTEEVFYLKDSTLSETDHQTKFSTDWLELTAREEGTELDQNTRTYVFAYKTVLASEGTTTPLFNTIQAKNILEGSIPFSAAQNITIDAYAIQASDVINASGTDLTDSLTAENLLTIYDTYVNQNN